MKRILLCLSLFVLILSCTKKEDPAVEVPKAEFLSLSLDGKSISPSSCPYGVGEEVEIVFSFTKELDMAKFDDNQLTCNGVSLSNFDLYTEGKNLILKTNSPLPYFKKISLNFYSGKNFGVELTENFKFSFITQYDPSDKLERLSDEALFEKVQKAAFNYFWDYAHPVSGLARERLGSGNTVTTGGSGFGYMCIMVGVHRGWISREEGAARVLQMTRFLAEKAQRYHGAWSHWLNGESGERIPFGSYDNGADLVETALLMEGILAAKEFFDAESADEQEFRALAQQLWEEVEWTWFQKDGEKKLYWHWSENYGWQMNMPISGWNEALIAYVLAAASPTHSIDKDVYEQGWARSGSLTFNTKSPMFFAHYSFMGLDPRNLSDQYGDYWKVNCEHALANYEYCAKSKKNYGYSSVCWGLTASDYYNGYTASSPSNDTGTVAPTAALASFPYLPEQAQGAMEYFYYVLGDRLWSDYGLKDAFSLKELWFANSYIAIDQGPIVVMMENYRSALVWDCFMKNADVRAGLDKLGFNY
ncbi:MAG: glucoamylase family protein [Candidatus Cryptobacteroides sp.]